MLTSAGQEGYPIAFNWNLIDSCQFKCSYCYAAEFNTANTIINGTHTEAYKLVLYKLATLDHDWTIDIQGGEPTMHPHLPDIVSALVSMPHCIKIVIATNLTKPIEYYTQLDTSSKVEIHASYHPEYHKKLTDRFICLASSLSTALAFTEVILHPSNQFFLQTITFMETLRQANVNFGVTIARSNDCWDGELTQEFFDAYGVWLSYDNGISQPIPHTYSTGELVNRYEQEIIAAGISYYGMNCQAMMYTIDVDGTVFNTCTTTKEPLKLHSEHLKRVITCPKHTTCDCSVMLRFRKTA